MCIKGVSEKTSRFDFYISPLSVKLLLTSQEIYSFPPKIEVGPVILHIITSTALTIERDIYGQILGLTNLEIKIHLNLSLFQSSSPSINLFELTSVHN